MAKKHDWSALRKEFLTGEFASLAEFAKYKNISYKTLYDRANKESWLKEKVEIKEEILRKSKDALINDSKERSIKVNKRHMEIADKFLTVLEKEIVRQAAKTNINAFVLEKLVASLEKCQKIHRTALGMDKDGAGNQEDRVASLFEQMKEVFNDEPNGVK